MASLIASLPVVATTARAPPLDWLLHPPTAFPAATANFNHGVLTLGNGLVERKFSVSGGLFACTSYQRLAADGQQPIDLLRTIKPEAVISLDDVTYTVGGAVLPSAPVCEMAACPDAANRGIFTDDVSLAALAPNASAWQYATHQLVSIEAPFAWKPGARHSPSDVAWPPLGVAVDVTFTAPKSAHKRHRRVLVVVRYELYQGAPLVTKRVTLRDQKPEPPYVEVTGLVVELLGLTQPASPLPLVSYAPAHRGEWGEGGAYEQPLMGGSAPMWGGAKGYPGLLWAEPDTPHVGGVSWEDDAPSLEANSLVPGSAPGAGEPVLRAAYHTELHGSAAEPLPPSRSWQKWSMRVALDPTMPGTEGGSLESFRVLELLLEGEGHPFGGTSAARTGLALRRMRRLLAPAVQENPIFMHLTADPHNLTAVDETLSQMAAVGFEMAIFSFGSGFDLESSDPAFLATVRNFTATARAAGIEVGAYDLIAETRGNPGNNYSWAALGADTGLPNGNACFASRWVEFLTAAVLRFVEETGFAAVETDGPYGGQPCASTEHAHHKHVNDSVYRQNYLQERFYRALKAKSLYVHQPDDYFYHGASKSGMGYNENQYSLPRWEDLHVSRASMFDDTQSTPVTMGWMFVPLVPYHAGGDAASFAPTNLHYAEYEWALAQYFGYGVMPCWRGPRLYDGPRTQRLVARWVAFYKQYRAILTSDLLHLRRPDGRSIDGVMHANAQLPDVQGLAFLFNPTGRTIATTFVLPLYFTGATDCAAVAREGNASDAEILTLARDYTAPLQVDLPPRSFAWYTIASVPCAGAVELA